MPAEKHLKRNCYLTRYFVRAVAVRDRPWPGRSDRPSRPSRGWGSSPNDPAVLTSIGQVMLGAGDAGSAAVIFQRAIEMEPNDPSHYLHAAMAWRAAHDSGKAIENAEKALRLDPMLEQPYRLLADIYREDRQPAMVHMTYERYLKAFPESIEAQRDVKESALPGHGSDR